MFLSSSSIVTIHSFLLLLSIITPGTDAQVVCGVQGTRCNGSFGAYVFYSCCGTGLICQPYDVHGGSCQAGPGYVPPSLPPVPLILDPNCGVQGTRCNGSFGVYTFFPCCQPYLMCVPYDVNGGACEYGPIATAPPTLPLPPSAYVSGGTPSQAPSNGGPNNHQSISIGFLLFIAAMGLFLL